MQVQDLWAAGEPYEAYVGRWSRLVANEFINWLAVLPGRAWLDVGCGTGALSQTVLQLADPKRIKGFDRSEGFVAFAQRNLSDPRATFAVADAESLPEDSGAFDAVVSGLMINFIPKPENALKEMIRVAKEGGVVAAYVWDYAGEMQFMRHFWDAAAELDPAAADLVEGLRFPLCKPEPLQNLFERAGLQKTEVRPIDIPTRFRNFDDYWNPFLGGQGPAPTYNLSLSEERRLALRERIRTGLPFAADGSISLIARAWAVRGLK